MRREKLAKTVRAGTAKELQGLQNLQQKSFGPDLPKHDVRTGVRREENCGSSWMLRNWMAYVGAKDTIIRRNAASAAETAQGEGVGANHLPNKDSVVKVLNGGGNQHWRHRGRSGWFGRFPLAATRRIQECDSLRKGPEY